MLVVRLIKMLSLPKCSFFIFIVVRLLFIILYCCELWWWSCLIISHRQYYLSCSNAFGIFQVQGSAELLFVHHNDEHITSFSMKITFVWWAKHNKLVNWRMSNEICSHFQFEWETPNSWLNIESFTVYAFCNENDINFCGRVHSIHHSKRCKSYFRFFFHSF